MDAGAWKAHAREEFFRRDVCTCHRGARKVHACVYVGACGMRMRKKR